MKHAYLIMAHNQFSLLKRLIKSLDDERNDIFIHIDKKSNEFNRDCLKNVCNKSNIYVLNDRIDVRWGHISIVECTISLLEYALNISNEKKIKYKYYHLLSGGDFPLTNQDKIHNFFDNRNNEFIHFAPSEKRDNVLKRYKYYWLTISKRNKTTLYARIINKLVDISIEIQEKLKISRNDESEIMFGSAWFSITNSCVEYVLAHKKWILKRYQHTLLPDESFLQTIVYNSPFLDRLYIDYEKQTSDDHLACVRKIDWKRGSPYVWQERDFQELITSGCMFARKFSEVGMSDNILDRIEKYIHDGKITDSGEDI